MRRAGLDPLGHRQTRRLRVDDERADAAAARRLARPREHDIEVGDPTVGYPRFFAVENERVARAFGARHERRGIGSGRRLREREGADRGSRADPRQIARLQLRRAAEGDRRASEALHREREIGQRVAPRQGLARKTDRARIERLERAAIRARHDIAQPAVAPQRRDEFAAGRVVVRIFGIGDMLRRPAAEVLRERPVGLVKKRQVEIRVHQSPSNTGARFAAKAS